MISVQESFDKIVKHLRQQKCHSLGASKEKYCKLRGKDNTKCAIGCLIPDDLYTSKMEIVSLYTLRDMLKDYLPENVHFLLKMRELHDNYKVEEWEENIIEMAKNYCLTIPENS